MQHFCFFGLSWLKSNSTHHFFITHKQNRKMKRSETQLKWRDKNWLQNLHISWCSFNSFSQFFFLVWISKWWRKKTVMPKERKTRKWFYKKTPIAKAQAIIYTQNSNDKMKLYVLWVCLFFFRIVSIWFQTGSESNDYRRKNMNVSVNKQNRFRSLYSMCV